MMTRVWENFETTFERNYTNFAETCVHHQTVVAESWVIFYSRWIEKNSTIFNYSFPTLSELNGYLKK